MAYRLKLNEPLDKGFRRIAAEQIAVALGELASGPDRVVAVHETRKAMKRIRALLKLIRPALADVDYKRENRRFGDIARLLSGTRDEDVLKATAARMAVRAGERAQALAAGLALADGNDRTPHVRQAIEALEEAREAIEKIPVRKSFSWVRRGLEKSYRSGRRSMVAAYEDGQDESFHEWRKAVQAHWRHMLLVSRCWPQVMEARAALAREAAELLGEDHDLYALIQTLKAKTTNGKEAAGARAMIAAAHARQRLIRHELTSMGKMLFAEPPSEFADRIALYWSAAKAARRIAKQSNEDAAGSDDAGSPASKTRTAAPVLKSRAKSVKEAESEGRATSDTASADDPDAGSMPVAKRAAPRAKARAAPAAAAKSTKRTRKPS